MRLLYKLQLSPRQLLSRFKKEYIQMGGIQQEIAEQIQANMKPFLGYNIDRAILIYINEIRKNLANNNNSSLEKINDVKRTTILFYGKLKVFMSERQNTYTIMFRKSFAEAILGIRNTLEELNEQEKAAECNTSLKLI